MDLAVIRAGSYAVFDGVAYNANIGAKKLGLFLPATGPRPDGWEDDSRFGVWFRGVPRAAASRLFVVLTWASLDGVDVKIEKLDIGTRKATVVASYPQGDQGKAGAPHPDLYSLADHEFHTNQYSGVVSADRLTDVWEWAEIDGSVESNKRPRLISWMGEEDNGEPWRRPKLPREKLLWRPEAQWGPWGRIEIDPLA